MQRLRPDHSNMLSPSTLYPLLLLSPAQRVITGFSNYGIVPIWNSLPYYSIIVVGREIVVGLKLP